MLFVKVVMVKVEMVIPRVVPAFWGAHEVEFQMNDGSWCCDNLANDLQRLLVSREGGPKCLCNATLSTYCRDATPEDVEGTDVSILAGL